MNHLTLVSCQYPVSDRWHCTAHMGDGGFSWTGDPLDALERWTAAIAHLHTAGPTPIDYNAVARLLEQRGAFTWGDDYTGLEVSHPCFGGMVMSDVSTSAQD